MLLAFRNTDDIKKRYVEFTSRNLRDRLCTMYYFNRQPRPHMSLSIYFNRRCRLIQDIQPMTFEFEVKLKSLRKERYNALRTSIPSNWRL